MSKKKRQRSPPKDAVEEKMPSVIPVGPRFQADLPLYTGPNHYISNTNSQWLGTKVWPVEHNHQNDDTAVQATLDQIGKGRVGACACQDPKSPKCIKKHVDEKKTKLKNELSPVFDDWKFDQMREEASRNWTPKERQKLESIVKKYPIGKSAGFLKHALKALPNQNKQNIISYYFNIIVPQRLRHKFGLGRSPQEICRDGDEVEPEGSASRTGKKVED